MNKKTTYLLIIFILLFILIIVQSVYLNFNNDMTKTMRDKKNTFVSLVGLSDLAVSTEATYIRSRSTSDLFSMYKDDPTLWEYFVSTYSISNSGIINQRNKNEK